MAGFVRGDVVVVPFPFSDLSTVKRRPALVLTGLEGSDCILCQITSQRVLDGHAIELDDADFETGALKVRSNVRPNRLFTSDGRIILYKVGRLKSSKVTAVVDKVVEILRG